MADFRAHPTTYAGTRFRSRLEARWAAMFDLIGWHWEYEPVDLPGWVPDFYVRFPCRHSECSGHHELYVEVKPYRTLAEFAGHPVAKREPYESPHPAMFGLAPDVTHWSMGHGAGGGDFDLASWIALPKTRSALALGWREAGNRVQWKGRR